MFDGRSGAAACRPRSGHPLSRRKNPKNGAIEKRMRGLPVHNAQQENVLRKARQMGEKTHVTRSDVQ
ncbi:MAG: hypothetical protein P8Y01_15550, partial [Woeseiaceae bacterium]